MAGDFNPLPRKEGDSAVLEYGQFSDISIHSLVKRETGLISDGIYAGIDFNPLPRKEGDS